ncbi:MAG: hypothetical protein SWZ49_05410, partial [Cyanobacteriota bacterium]|nr:hypothetical protein [Cyanobacteriota bacterium]
IKISIDNCVYSSSNILIREYAKSIGIKDLDNNPPPCLLIAIGEVVFSSMTGNHLSIESAKRFNEENREEFVIVIDE